MSVGLEMSESRARVVEPFSPTADRLLDAACVLVARWGVAKTTVADIAKEAGSSRATLYRAFPGGKQELLLALGRRELSTYLSAITDAVHDAGDLDEALTMALVVASRLLADHDAAQFVLAHEPGLLLPFIGFGESNVLFAFAADELGPALERFLPADDAAWAAEWATRLFLSYLFSPDEACPLSDPARAGLLVCDFVLPAFTPVPA